MSGVFSALFEDAVCESGRCGLVPSTRLEITSSLSVAAKIEHFIFSFLNHLVLFGV